MKKREILDWLLVALLFGGLFFVGKKAHSAPTFTSTISPTFSITPTITITATPSATPSDTSTFTATRTATVTRTASITRTATRTSTFTITPSPTRTPRYTLTPTPTLNPGAGKIWPSAISGTGATIGEILGFDSTHNFASWATPKPTDTPIPAPTSRPTDTPPPTPVPTWTPGGGGVNVGTDVSQVTGLGTNHVYAFALSHVPNMNSYATIMRYTSATGATTNYPSSSVAYISLTLQATSLSTEYYLSPGAQTLYFKDTAGTIFANTTTYTVQVWYNY